jgi:uncharacterized protein YgiM (DUF1202 family)
LYYLNLYSQPANNSQTEEKIKELALKKNLEGYNHPSSHEKLTRFLQENQVKIASVFIGIILFLVGFIFFQKTKTQQIPVASAIILVGFLTMLFWLINFTDPKPAGIIEASNTYIMEGPSSGSAVLAIIGEGHKLIVDGKYDVWLKIKWNGKVAFVKESSLLLLHLN